MVAPPTEFDSSRFYETANLIVALLHDGPVSREELPDIVKRKFDVSTNEVNLILSYLNSSGYLQVKDNNLYLRHRLYT